MGAWEAGNFDNDNAMNWKGDLCESGSTSIARTEFILTSLILILASTVCSQVINIQNYEDHEYLKRVVQFYGIKSVHSKEDIVTIDTGKVNVIEANTLGVENPEYERKLVPLVKYSKDKRRYIDYASYSTIIKIVDKQAYCSFDVDTEVSIGDVTTGKKYRVEFVGTLEWVEGAGWVSNDSILIVKRNSETKLIIFKFINLKTKRYTEYAVKPKMNSGQSYFYTELAGICKIDK